MNWTKWPFWSIYHGSITNILTLFICVLSLPKATGLNSAPQPNRKRSIKIEFRSVEISQTAPVLWPKKGKLRERYTVQRRFLNLLRPPQSLASLQQMDSAPGNDARPAQNSACLAASFRDSIFVRRRSSLILHNAAGRPQLQHLEGATKTNTICEQAPLLYPQRVHLAPFSLLFGIFFWDNLRSGFFGWVRAVNFDPPQKWCRPFREIRSGWRINLNGFRSGAGRSELFSTCALHTAVFRVLLLDLVHDADGNAKRGPSKMG